MNTTYTKHYSIEEFKDIVPEVHDGDKRCTLFDKPSMIEEDCDTDEERSTMYINSKQQKSDVSVAGAYLHDMQHDEDPKELILKKIGDISSEEFFGSRVVVATYIRPERKKSGLIITNSVREEDKFQGKVGLVIALGPVAFKREGIEYGGNSVKIGDWVVYRPMDGHAQSIKGNHCRVLEDEDIVAKVSHPDLVL